MNCVNQRCECLALKRAEIFLSSTKREDSGTKKEEMGTNKGQKNKKVEKEESLIHMGGNPPLG